MLAAYKLCCVRVLMTVIGRPQFSSLPLEGAHTAWHKLFLQAASAYCSKYHRQMATSLAEQLRKLQTSKATPAKNVLPSLLYEPKEAALLDLDSVHALGVNGLTELVGLDRRYGNANSLS